jgi:hypothetical protein
MRPNPEDLGTVYCEDCGQECTAHVVDHGIGKYEFWGTVGYDHNYTLESNCCDAPLLDHDPCCSECGKHEVYDYGLCFACHEAAFAET